MSAAFQLFHLPRGTAISNNLTLVAGARVRFFLTTTVTPTPVYQDSALTAPHTQPVVADSAGRLPAVYLDPSIIYRVTFTDGADVEIYPAVDPVNDQVLSANAINALLTQVGIGAALYPQTAAEITAGVTPVNYAYPSGDLRRYGCDITGGTDNTTQITNAINTAVAAGGTGYIYHPGGTIAFGSQITIPSGLTIQGLSRAAAVFKFTGSPAGSPAATRAAFRYTGVAPWSGYANVTLRDFHLIYQNTVNFAAAIELSAWGWSYWNIENIWISGNCSYSLILDGTEICTVSKCLFETLNAISNRGIWIVNGNDRGFGLGPGFSNVITISGCQISNGAGSYGILDDGGNAHIIEGSNFNQNSIPLYVAGAQNLTLRGNSYETTLSTGPANVYFASVSGDQGIPVGPVHGFVIDACGFYGRISGGALLVFTGTLFSISAITKASPAVITFSMVSSVNPFIVGEQIFVSGVVGMTQINGQSLWVTAIGGSSGAWTATVVLDSSAYGVYGSGGQAAYYHRGGTIKGNTFGANLGRGGAIDCAFLANSWAGPNCDDSVSSSFSHYINVHNDVQGNTLLPPQNGFIGTVGITGPTYGDTRFRTIYDMAIQEQYVSIPYSASMTFDLGTANCFEINASNGTAFLINSPSNAAQGGRYSIRLKNTSGGALGAITFGGSFKLAGGAWVTPATGTSRTIVFNVDGAGLSVEAFRTATDIPN